jgi:hypothetical protein
MRKRATLVVLFISSVSTASAQQGTQRFPADSAQRALRVTRATLEQSARGPTSPMTTSSQVTIQAAQKDAAATVSLVFASGLALEFSTPIQKDAEQTDFLTLDGLATGTAAAVAKSWYRGKLVPRSSADMAAVESVCGKYGVDRSNCNSGSLESHLLTLGQHRRVQQALDEYDVAFFKQRSVTGATLKLKSAYERFSFFESGGESASTDKVGGSASVTLFHVSGATRISLSASGEYAYGAGQTLVLRCDSVADTALRSCETRPLSGPVAKRETVIRGELRQLGRVGLSPVVSWRVSEGIYGIDLPVYVVTDDNGALTGGVRVGWRSDSRLQVAAFVSKPLALH